MIQYEYESPIVRRIHKNRNKVHLLWRTLMGTKDNLPKKPASRTQYPGRQNRFKGLKGKYLKIDRILNVDILLKGAAHPHRCFQQTYGLS